MERLLFWCQFILSFLSSCLILTTVTTILITVTMIPTIPTTIPNIICPFRSYFPHMYHLRKYGKLSKCTHFGERWTAYRFGSTQLYINIYSNVLQQQIVLYTLYLLTSLLSRYFPPIFPIHRYFHNHPPRKLPIPFPHQISQILKSAFYNHSGRSEERRVGKEC